MTLLMTTGSLTIAAGAVIFLVITLILVGALLAAKAKLVPSGNVNLNDHIFLHFALTCQTPVFLNLFTREKALFCRQENVKFGNSFSISRKSSR